MRGTGRLDRRWVAWVAAGAAFGVMPACGGDSEPEVPGGATQDRLTVIVRDIAFKPGTTSVMVGDTVTWRFEDKGIPHDVVAKDDSFESDKKDSGIFRHTFDKAGTFSYICTIHPGMEGTVRVT